MLSRRELLSAPGLLTFVDSPAPAIRKIRAFPAPYGVTSYFRFLPKPERPSVSVKLTCEDGTVGWGQSVLLPTWSYETPESVLSNITDYLAPALQGKRITDLDAIHTAMKKSIASSFSTGSPIAKAGIDLAVHDMLGQMARSSLPDLWARHGRKRIELSWTVNARSMAEAEQLVADGKKRGYRHFNLKVASDPKFDLELCKYVRSQRPSSILWIDANGGYDLETALRLTPKFAELGGNVFEQPIAPNRLTGLPALKQQGAQPIILDEGVVSSVELTEFIRLGLLDGVAMKPAHCESFRCSQTSGTARRCRIDVSGQRPNRSRLFASGVSSTLRRLWIEASCGSERPQFLFGSYLKDPLTLRDGFLAVPQGPRLGVEVDERRLALTSNSR